MSEHVVRRARTAARVAWSVAKHAETDPRDVVASFRAVPVLGFLDDAAFVAEIAVLIAGDIARYRAESSEAIGAAAG